jgi:hypothetical protein
MMIMFSNLSAGALGLSLDHPTAIDLAQKHGFGGVDPDLGFLRSLDGTAAIAEHAAAVRERGLQWGITGLPVPLTAPAEEFRAALADLPATLELLTAAGVTSVGTWLRPMHDDLNYRRNWVLHVSRLNLVGELLADAGLRLGLEYIGPKTFCAPAPSARAIEPSRSSVAKYTAHAGGWPGGAPMTPPFERPRCWITAYGGCVPSISRKVHPKSSP